MSDDARDDGKKGCTGLDNPNEPLQCAFSSLSKIQVGTGTTAKKQVSKLLWYVVQRDVCEYGVRKINPQFVPVGDEDLINHEELMEKYTPEVEIHNARVMPAMQALKKNVAKGDKHRKSGELLSAEMEYEQALEVDETNVRAIFGLGLVYLERDDRENSRAVFEQLVGMQAAFDERHKHLFNEFGIRLRKSELYDEAIQYYSRAVELTRADENLHYNLARAFYEKGDWPSCFEFVSRALGQNAGHKPAKGLCRFIAAAASDANLRERYAKPPVPEDVANRAAELRGDPFATLNLDQPDRAEGD